ncbi:SpdA protein [Streptomyces sp. OE57]|uniref:SpdA protein n=1 Tax=Streptomyces lacaronensis TaxID=3379885 RepID=UPI0039B7341A
MTAIMAAVVGLTFLFGFGNVWSLALRLGVPPWVAPLVAPAVDLSVLGLLLGIRHLALHGAGAEELRPARRLLLFSSLMTLALNVADPLIAGHLGKAAFDAVGPLLLIGWADVGPGLLQAIGAFRQTTVDSHTTTEESGPTHNASLPHQPGVSEDQPDDLLERARREDARHWKEHQRPISAETLRKRLHVGAARSRMLVAMVRSGDSHQPGRESHGDDTAVSGLDG